MQKSFPGIFFFLTVLLSTLGACSDDPLAVVTTSPVTNITATTAQSGGQVDTKGGSAPQQWGICWSTTPGPTIVNSRTKDFVGKSPSFLSSMQGLSPNTKYYVRAYSNNQAGIAYGNEVSFRTLP